MILVTGAAGFIASCLVHRILRLSPNVSLLVVDDFSIEKKLSNIQFGDRVIKIDRKNLLTYLKAERPSIESIFHLGARTDTAEKNVELFNELNVQYSKDLWTYAVNKQIPFLYASSAATYGDGKYGFDDDHAIVKSLKPLNPYGDSKQTFDLWALEQVDTPPNWFGIKFFNVYGPNEYHKGRMASVIFHTFHQILKTNKMNLFRSHNPNFKDGEQSRDFIYVEDAIKCCQFLVDSKADSGLYNVGTGVERSFRDLAKATFTAMNKKDDISFIDTPLDIRETYQYYTKANMSKLLGQGYENSFLSLEEGIEKYVKQYLLNNANY